MTLCELINVRKNEPIFSSFLFLTYGNPRKHSSSVYTALSGLTVFNILLLLTTTGMDSWVTRCGLEGLWSCNSAETPEMSINICTNVEEKHQGSPREEDRGCVGSDTPQKQTLRLDLQGGLPVGSGPAGGHFSGGDGSSQGVQARPADCPDGRSVPATPASGSSRQGLPSGAPRRRDDGAGKCGREPRRAAGAKLMVSRVLQDSPPHS